MKLTGYQKNVSRVNLRAYASNKWGLNTPLINKKQIQVDRRFGDYVSYNMCTLNMFWLSTLITY